MKILIVSGSFYPVNAPRAFRTTELAKELKRQGHEVTVLFPHKGYNYETLEKSLGIKLKNISLNWKTLLLFKGNIGHRLNMILSRLLIMAFDYPQIEYLFRLPKLLKSESDYDLLISIAVPHPIHWGVSKALKQNSKLAKKWVADCGDPYMLARTDSFNKWFYFKWIEKSWCKRADFITIPIEEGKNGYFPEFHSKIRVIPQGFNFDLVDETQFSPNLVPTFGFAGRFIPGRRDPRPFLDLLLELGVDFRFHIYTIQEDLVKPYQLKLGERLIIHSFIPRDELIETMKSYDFLLNLENGTTTQSPSKLIDYALTKRPILSIDSQNMDQDKLKNFLKGDYSAQLIIENIDRYNIVNVANSFLNL